MSEVIFLPLGEGSTEQDVLDGIARVYEAADFSSLFKKDDFLPIKVHFGEKGNNSYLNPEYVSKVVSLLGPTGAKCFVTDANTIYRGMRANAVDHLRVAFEHGFTPEKMGAPVMIADGLSGKDQRMIEIDQKHFREIKVAPVVPDSDSMMVLSHFKGHMLAGFGGGLKNIGMGLASRSGKQEQHSDAKASVEPEVCTGCFTCMSSCPVDAILDNGESAVIDKERCIGCGECTVACRPGAISVRWRTGNRVFQEKMVEYAYGILDQFEGGVGFINFVLNVTPHCDCMETDDPPVVEDIGILASRDPVSLDQACVDLVNSSPGLESSDFGERLPAIPAGEDKFYGIHDIDSKFQLAYAEELGLGTRQYDLRMIA